MKKKQKKTESAPATERQCRIEHIGVNRIRPNKWNRRRALTADFVESIRTHGILQPPVVRKVPGGWHELISGERRLDAAKSIGHTNITCKIIEADDALARELTLVENINRANFTPLEEAAEIAELYELNNHNAAEVAARLGCSRRFVKARLALSKLDLDALKELAVKPELMPIACLELMALTPAETQNELLRNCYEYVFYDYKELRDAILKVTNQIGGKLFDAEDETLMPMAGACSRCLKRTGADPDLFGNVDGLKDGDRCLDKECFRSKVRAALTRKETDARRKHGAKLLLVAKSIPWEDKSQAEAAKVMLVDQHYRCKLRSAKKTDEGAMPGFVWCGPGAGSVIWVKAAEGEQLPANARPKTSEEKRDALAKRRMAMVGEKVREAIMSKMLLVPRGKDGWVHLISIVLKYGCYKAATEPQTLNEAIKEVTICTNNLRAATIAHDSPSRAQMLNALNEICGDDAEIVLTTYEFAAEQTLPEPKSWAKSET